MKGKIESAKKALALTLAMSLCGTQAFAGDALSAAAQGVQEASQKTVEEDVALPELTMEEAVAKAKRHSPDLRKAEDTLDYVDEMMDDIDADGVVTVPSVEYKKWVDDGWHTLVSAVYQLEQSQKQARLSRDLQNLVLELSVKASFTAIKNNGDSLNLARKNAEIQKTLYEQGYTKYRLKLLSQYNLDKLEIAAQQAAAQVTLLENAGEQLAIKLNDLMGEGADARFTYVYAVDFTPYQMTQSMEQYINAALKNDLSIALVELQLDSAEFSKNYVGYSNTSTDSNTQEYNYDNAKRDLKTAKTDKAAAIRNAYLQLQQVETQIASAQSDLTKAEADYRAAQLNLQSGNATQITVEQAELGVISAKNSLNQLIYNYDMLVYQFEHTSLLGSTQ